MKQMHLLNNEKNQTVTRLTYTRYNLLKVIREPGCISWMLLFRRSLKPRTCLFNDEFWGAMYITREKLFFKIVIGNNDSITYV